MVEERFSVKDNLGGEAPAIFSRPEGEVRSGAVLCHGFLSNSKSNTNLALTQALNTKGIATVRFDFFGHGQSKGDFADLTLTQCVDQLERVLGWFKTKGIRKVGMVGSSFGGLVVLLVAENHPELRTLALKCPVSEYPSIWRTQLGEAGMQSWQTSGVTTILNDEGNRARLNYGFYEDILKFDAYASAGQIRLPTLIVHGDADVDVPLDQSKRLQEALVGEKRLDVVPGADHMFSKPEDFQNMIIKITDWMVEKLR